MMCKKIFGLVCLIPAFIFGEIVESNRMDSVLNYADSDTWVLFDVDNTLIESSMQMGSAQWREHILLKARAAGYDEEGAQGVVDLLWFVSQQFVPVKAVDEQTPDVLEKLKKSNIIALALTARDEVENDHTQLQLNSAGIDLQNDAFDSSMLFGPENSSLYENGVIYCGDNSKDVALLAFIQALGRMPKKIVLVDDRLSHLEAIEKALVDLGIEFIGIRFGGADERVKAFDGLIADIQWATLPIVVSDEEAKAAYEAFSKSSLD